MKKGEIKEMLTSKNREDRMFALAYTKKMISLAERLYKKTKRTELIEIIDRLYEAIEDYNINKEVLSPEVVNGFKCNHIKLHITYKMKMKIAFIKKTFNVEEVKEIWATKDFKYFNDYNNPFIKKNFKTGFEELDKAIKEQIGMYKEIGFPIKTITISIQNKKETKTVTEVSNVQQKTFPKSFFEIPKDYQLLESPYSR